MQAKAGFITTVSTPTLSPSSSTTVGTLVTLSVTIPSIEGIIPTGTVTFLVEIGSGSFSNFGSGPVVGGASGGSASITYTPSSAGNYMFQADYGGDGAYNAANSTPASLTVNQASATVGAATFTPTSPITLGASVTVSATVSGLSGVAAPTGNVQFEVSINGGSYANFGTAASLSGGSASVQYTPLTPATYNFEAVYQGDGNYVSGTVGGHSGTLTVNKAVASVPAPSLSLSGTTDAGTSVILSVTISGSGATPTGTVTFQVKIGSGSYSTIGSAATLNSGGSASTTYTPLTADSYQFQVVYSGDSNYAGLTSSAASLTVNSALVAPTVSASASSVDQSQTSALSSTAVSTGTSPYTYQWLEKSPGGSFVNVGTNSASYSFVTSGSTATGSWSFELQVTDASSTSVTSNAVSVTVNIAPTVSVSPSSWTMDVGQSKTFTADPAGGSGGYSSSGYQWYVGGIAQSGQTASTFSSSPNSAGSPLITVTVTDSLGVISSQSAAPSVTVSVSPTVSIAPVGPVALDVGQIQVFTATISGGSGSLSYQWYLDGVVAGGNSASYSYTASGSSHSVTCKVTDSASAPVTSPASNSVSVSVNAGLVVSVSPSSWTMDVNQNEIFNASAIGGSSGYTYKWYLNSILVSGQTSSTYTFTASAAGSVSVYAVVTDSANIPATSNKATITVSASLTVSISPVGPLTLDASQVQTFTAKASGGSGTINYQWYEDITKVGTDSPNYSYSAAGSSHSINCTVTDSASTPVTLSSNAVSVTVNSAFGLPTVSDSANKVDQGQTSTLSSTAVSGGTGPYTYQWLWLAPNGGSYSPISGATFTSYSFVTSNSTASGSWSFELEVNDSISQMVISDPVSITVSASPTVSIAPVGPLTLDVGQVQVFTATASGGSGVVHYQWYEDVTKVGTDSASYSYTAAGQSHVITCVVTDSASSPVTSPASNAVNITVNSATSTPTSTPTPKPTITPTPTPSTTTNVTATTGTGATVDLAISGNVTSSQISDAIIASYLPTKTTTVSFTITGPNGTAGFGNMTIPKTAVYSGSSPILYIDGLQASNQGYTQDANNFYVWFTTSFSTHQVSIQFVVSSTSPVPLFGSVFAVGIAVIEIISIFTVIAVRRLRREPENA